MNPFEFALKEAQGSEFHAPVIDVMDTYAIVSNGLEHYSPKKWTAADAVELTKLVFARKAELAAQSKSE